MKTCAYCGSQLQDSYCAFCEMELSDRYIMTNGNRLDTTINAFPDKQGIFKNTDELLQLETIELICLLRHAREYRAEVYKLRILTHKAKETGADMKDIETSSYADYDDATKKVRVIENILLDRIGYFPEKVNDKLLDTYLRKMEKSKSKRMVMKKKIKAAK